MVRPLVFIHTNAYIVLVVVIKHDDEIQCSTTLIECFFLRTGKVILIFVRLLNVERDMFDAGRTILVEGNAQFL